VKRLVPEARANEKPEAGKAGWIDLLVAHERTGQHDQEVHYQFKDGRLMGVNVNEGAPFG
jgi:hypothetical protein